jgi:hypothetical protein
MRGRYFLYHDEYEFTFTYTFSSNPLEGYKPEAILKYRYKLDENLKTRDGLVCQR